MGCPESPGATERRGCGPGGERPLAEPQHKAGVVGKTYPALSLLQPPDHPPVGIPSARGQVKPVGLAAWGIESEESSLPGRERVEENSREWI